MTESSLIPEKDQLKKWLFSWGQYLAYNKEAILHGDEYPTSTCLDNANNAIYFVCESLNGPEKRKELKAQGIDLDQLSHGHPIKQLIATLRSYEANEYGKDIGAKKLDEAIIRKAEDYFSKQAALHPVNSHSYEVLNKAWEAYCEMLNIEKRPFTPHPDITKAAEWARHEIAHNTALKKQALPYAIAENLVPMGRKIGLEIESCEPNQSNPGELIIRLGADDEEIENTKKKTPEHQQRILRHKLQYFFTVLNRAMGGALLEDVKYKGRFFAFTPSYEPEDIALVDANTLVKQAENISPLLVDDIPLKHLLGNTQKLKPDCVESTPKDIISAAFIGAKLGIPAQIDWDHNNKTLMVTLPEHEPHLKKRLNAALATLATVGLQCSLTGHHQDMIGLRIDQGEPSALESANPTTVMDLARKKLNEEIGRPIFHAPPKTSNSRFI